MGVKLLNPYSKNKRRQCFFLKKAIFKFFFILS